MSARSFKIFLGVFLAHIILLNIVWVGFSAPGPRPPARFIYQGALPAEVSGSGQEDEWQNSKAADQFAVEHQDVSYSDRWTGLRDPSKPLTYDHLGF